MTLSSKEQVLAENCTSTYTTLKQQMAERFLIVNVADCN